MLDRNSSTPLHMQLEDVIKEKISSEEWLENAQIPSENELSKIYGLSRMTVRSVITRLVLQGLLKRVSGKGTYVADAKITSFPPMQMGIQEQLDRLGIESSTKLLKIIKIQVPVKMIKELKLTEDSLVFCLTRVRLMKDEPLSIHTSYIPAELCPDLEKNEFEKEQLCDILENKYQLKAFKIVETLESAYATVKDADRLKVQPNFPVLKLENTMFTTDGIPFEHTRIIFRGDRIKLRQEYYKDL